MIQHLNISYSIPSHSYLWHITYSTGRRNWYFDYLKHFPQISIILHMTTLDERISHSHLLASGGIILFWSAHAHAWCVGSPCSPERAATV